MPPLISAELMEETWHAVAGMPAEALQRLQALCGEEQEALTGFALASLTERSSDAAGVGLYTHVVLMEAFRRRGGGFRTIGPEQIERAWDDNAAFVERLERAGAARRPVRLEPDEDAEPAALQYVFDALTEDDEDDPIDIDGDDFRHVVRTLKTVIDCMHDAHHPG